VNRPFGGREKTGPGKIRFEFDPDEIGNEPRVLGFQEGSGSPRFEWTASMTLKIAGLILLALLAAKLPGRNASSGDGREDWKPGRTSLKIKSGGWERVYHLQIPTIYDGKKAIPVVLIFHGAGGGGALYLARNGWAEKAEKEGFLAVAPDGLAARPGLPPQFLLNPRLWNDGQLRTEGPRARVDDVAFVRDLLEELGRKFNIDSSRVYIAGHSNGAGMVFHLGARLADRFAAIAAVAGHCWDQNPSPSRPLPTVYIIGSKDPLVRLEGGDMISPWGKRTYPPVSRTLTKWAAAIGVSADPVLVRDVRGVRVERFGPAGAKAALTVYIVEGQGHGWPGGQESGLPRQWIGPSVKTFKATDEIWNFFKNIR
jgi:polyhydroxybutyrate depolymerase